MSNTKTVAAKPYFNLAVEEELAREDAEMRGDQKPNSDTDGSGSADQTTQTTSDAATSESKDENYKERWVNLKRYHDTSIHEARTQIKELEARLQAASAASVTPPTNAEELEKFKQEKPELYNQMKEMFTVRQESAVDIDKYHEMQEQLIKSRQELALEQIKLAHPDMIDIVATDEFNQWVDKQAASIQTMIRENSEDAAAFIRALDLYKLDAGITSSVKGTSSEKSNDDASAADAVLTTGASTDVGNVEGRVWTREEIAKLHPSEYEMFEEDIDAAWREGRVR